MIFEYFKNHFKQLTNPLLIALFLSLPLKISQNELVRNQSKNNDPQIVKDYKSYVLQIKNNFPKVNKYINFFSSFDTLDANKNVITKKNLETYVISLLTQEANFVQKKPDGSLLQSWVGASGVSQFTTEGVKALNNYLMKKRDTVGKSVEEKILAEKYRKIKDIDFELIQQTDSLGVEEGLRAATLLSKIQLQRHEGYWRFAAIEYNWGRSLKGSYIKVAPHIPRETRDYVNRIEQHMKRYSLDNYERYLEQRWGVLMIELENMYGNKSLQKEDTLIAKSHYSNALELDTFLKRNNLDTLMRYQEVVIMHSHYELGEIYLHNKDTIEAVKHFSYVLKNSKKNRYENKNAEFYISKIFSTSKDSILNKEIRSLIFDTIK